MSMAEMTQEELVQEVLDRVHIRLTYFYTIYLIIVEHVYCFFIMII